MLKFYKRPPAIRAISFDLDDTLYDNVPIINKAESSLLAYLNSKYSAYLNLDAEVWQQKKADFIAKNQLIAHDVSLLRKRFLADLLTNSGVGGANSKALQAYEYFHQHRNNFMVSQNCIDILLELKKHIPLIAITNGNAEPELIGLGGIFDYVIRPQDELLMKPDQGIFLKACELLNLPAQNIAHVGDSHITDVKGAVHSKMIAGWFNPHGELLQGQTLPSFEYTNTQDLLSLI
ncbi:HAD-IA family hydrolase [Catenovulum sp. 2E275]|uniref:HAD-IA family hydrolase n=1 Tax=Catenovulum sp. 2E275 TaxID=2980497 RepID=UPI0021D35E97|nr:HAD-IA family hydrolase [Catenovulum sp. 2E275]MCU4675095.1 HAD-IA family hydrolase [Catenovulum sp. 2E275]